MGCNCNNQRRKDLNYIKRLAYAFGKDLKADVQIYAFYIGLTKYYDFDELPTREKRSEIIEVIRFSQPESNNVLQNTGKPGSKPVNKTKVQSRAKPKSSGKVTGKVG